MNKSIKSNNPHKSTSTNKYLVPHVGIVKENSDAQRMGRLLVHIPDLGGEPDKEENWFLVRYMSPFAGATPITESLEDSEDWHSTQSAYGMWFPVPDIDNHVVIMFLNGDPAKGFYIGGFYQQFMNNSVPGLPGTKQVYNYIARNPDPDKPDAPPVEIKYAPTTEYNKKVSKSKKIDPFDPKRPPHVPLFAGLSTQGLTGDYTRGVNTSSARRSQLSRTYGFLTPRGTQIVFDDGYLESELFNGTSSDIFAEDLVGDTNKKTNQNPALRNDGPIKGAEDRIDEYIRFRTRSGAQMTINETHGYIYLISRDGNNWVEMANDGHIDIYARDDISIHSEQSINLNADKDVNIEAGRNINIKARGDHVEYISKVTLADDNSQPIKEIKGDINFGTGNIYIESGPSVKGNHPHADDKGINNSNIHITSHNSTYQHVEADHHIVVDGNSLLYVKKDLDEIIDGDNLRTIYGENGFDLSVAAGIRQESGDNFSCIAGGYYAEDARPDIWMNSQKTESADLAGKATNAVLPKVYNLVEKEKGITTGNKTITDISTGNLDVQAAITDRVPEHEPWAGHREKAYLDDVKIDTDPAMSASSIKKFDKEAENATPADKIEKAPTSSGSTDSEIAAEFPPGTSKLGPISESIKSSPKDTSAKQDISTMQLSKDGTLALLDHESFRATQYYDHKGNSIGYGHLITGKEAPPWPEKFARGLTEEEAYELFQQDSQKYQSGVKKKFANTDMTQGQYDSMVSMSYNIGTSGMGTQLSNAVRSGDSDATADTMLLYNKAGGKVNEGLIRRREADARMFRNGEYPPSKSRAEHKATEITRLQRGLRNPTILEPTRGIPTSSTQIAQAEGALSRMT